MPPVRLSRRELLEKGIALGVIGVAAGLTPAAAAEAWEAGVRRRTPENVVGPFYKKGAPDLRGMRVAGEPGMPLGVTGSVFDTRGDAVLDAVVEVWHTDHLGLYDLDGFRHRARLAVAAGGTYGFDSVMPGHYPDRVCQHVHYLVTAPGHRPLVTQLYFATDPVFEGDPAKNFHRDPLLQTADLVRPVTLFEKPGEVHAQVAFELCVEKA